MSALSGCQVFYSLLCILCVEWFCWIISWDSGMLYWALLGWLGMLKIPRKPQMTTFYDPSQRLRLVIKTQLFFFSECKYMQATLYIHVEILFIQMILTQSIILRMRRIISCHPQSKLFTFVYICLGDDNHILGIHFLTGNTLFIHYTGLIIACLSEEYDWLPHARRQVVVSLIL